MVEYFVIREWLLLYKDAAVPFLCSPQPKYSSRKLNSKQVKWFNQSHAAKLFEELGVESKNRASQPNVPYTMQLLREDILLQLQMKMG